MRRYGLWATNSGQNPDIESMVDLVRNGCYTLMDSGHSVAEARFIKERYPDADILIRHNQYYWRDKDPIEWGREVVERMRDYAPLGIHRLVGANEPNLEPINDFTRQMFIRFGDWYTVFAGEVHRLDPGAFIHMAAMAAGHHEDVPHPEEGWIGLQLAEMVEAIDKCQAVNLHCYWDPDEGPLHVMSNRGGGLRYRHTQEVLQEKGIDKPIWIDEAGPWGEPWQIQQTAIHSAMCQKDDVRVTYFLWADPTENEGNTINQWWGRVDEQTLQKLSEAWQEIAEMELPPPPPPIVEVWGAPEITPWKDLCVKYGVASGVDPRVVGTMIYIESSGRSTAIGASGEVGLMQIISNEMFEDRPTPSQLLNPDFNISWGTGHLAGLLIRYDNDLRKALIAYNAGVGWLAEHPNADDTVVGYVHKFSVTWNFLWADTELPTEKNLNIIWNLEEATRHIEEVQRRMDAARFLLIQATEALKDSE